MFYWWCAAPLSVPLGCWRRLSLQSLQSSADGLMEAGDVVKSHIDAINASVIYIQLPRKSRVHINKEPSCLCPVCQEYIPPNTTLLRTADTFLIHFCLNGSQGQARLKCLWQLINGAITDIVGYILSIVCYFAEKLVNLVVTSIQ